MKNEIKNNIVHMFIGSAVAGVVFLVVNFLWIDISVVLVAHAVVLVVSIAIEIFQYYKWDNKDLKIVDRIFDVIGYQVGCGLIDLYTRGILL